MFTLAPADPGGPRGPGEPCDPFIINNKQKKSGDWSLKEQNSYFVSTT